MSDISIGLIKSSFDFASAQRTVIRFWWKLRVCSTNIRLPHRRPVC
jgi:hypothetical protein